MPTSLKNILCFSVSHFLCLKPCFSLKSRNASLLTRYVAAAKGKNTSFSSSNSKTPPRLRTFVLAVQNPNQIQREIDSNVCIATFDHEHHAQNNKLSQTFSAKFPPMQQNQLKNTHAAHEKLLQLQQKKEPLLFPRRSPLLTANYLL